MPKKKVQLDTLQQFLPAGSYEPVLFYLRQHKVHLTITRKRKSILGDYRHRTDYHNHRISINGNLNVYSFLITLLHELAHLLAFERFGNRIPPHGPDWKRIYSGLLHQFLITEIFPKDIRWELQVSLNNPAASCCAEEGLIRVLRKYDVKGPAHLLLEELPPAAFFRTQDGRIFKKGEKLRKRFKCLDVQTSRDYLFSPVFEVEVISR